MCCTILYMSETISLSIPEIVRNNPQIMVAQEKLRRCLESSFAETSAECRMAIAELRNKVEDESPVQDWEDSPTFHRERSIAAKAAHQWRKQTVGHVNDAFYSIEPVVRHLLKNSDKSSEITKELAWEVICPFFEWALDSSENMNKFIQWQKRAVGGSNYIIDGFLPLSVECPAKCNLAELLHCDFRVLIDKCPTEPRDGVLPDSDLQKSKAETVPPPTAGALKQYGSLPPYAEDPCLESSGPKHKKAVCRLLERIRMELNHVRPWLDRVDELEELAPHFKGYVVFEPPLEALLLDHIHKDGGAKFKDLACKLVGAKTGLSAATVRRFPTRYNKVQKDKAKK